MRWGRGLRVVGIALAVGTTLATSSCGQGAPQTRFATWKQDWAGTDRGYEATFRVTDGCVLVKVDGTEYLAALREGSTVGDHTVTTGDQRYRLDEKVTIGGMALEGDAVQVEADLTVPSECSRFAERVWLTRRAEPPCPGEAVRVERTR